MKKIFFFIIISSSLNLLAQQTFDKWENVELKDKFGDKTGEVIKSILVKGKFSNTATTDSDLIVKISDYGKHIKFSFYEYNKPPEATIVSKTRIGRIYIKRANGEEETHRGYAMSYGGVYLNKKRNKLTKLIRNGNGEIIKVFIWAREFSIYGKSTYSFSLKTQEN